MSRPVSLTEAQDIYDAAEEPSEDGLDEERELARLEDLAEQRAADRANRGGW